MTPASTFKKTKEVPAEGCPGKRGNGRSYAKSFLSKLLLVYLYEATVLPVTSTRPHLHYTYTHWGLWSHWTGGTAFSTWSFGDNHIVHKLGYIWNHTPLGWLSKTNDGIISPWTHISGCCSYIQIWNLDVGSNNTKLEGEGYWFQSKRVRSRVLSNLSENSLEDQQFSCNRGKIAFTFSYIVQLIQHGSWYGYYTHAHHSKFFVEWRELDIRMYCSKKCNLPSILEGRT